MKKLILFILLSAIGWQAYSKFQTKQLVLADAHEEVQTVDLNQISRTPVDTSPPRTFTCDGRTYCSQMTSCEEATLFCVTVRV
jgi:hypothetical protein